MEYIILKQTVRWRLSKRELRLICRNKVNVFFRGFNCEQIKFLFAKKAVYWLFWVFVCNLSQIFGIFDIFLLKKVDLNRGGVIIQLITSGIVFLK